MPDAEDDHSTASDLEAALASLAYLLTRSQEHERRMARAGITATRSDVYLLRAVAEAEGASRVSDLAERLMVKPSHVTRQIDRLQGQHLVERTQDTLDRRARQVEITAAGRGLLERLKQANIDTLTAALDGVPEADIAATTGVLLHLMDHYVHRVRTAMLSEHEPFPAPNAGADGATGAVAEPARAGSAAHEGG
ncbi:MarR family winged helix-turn-helix transcriptional regulator [Streptomyces sp. FH025]|uniref:MarR family winged helix-turn-helix transcriptional regulator n=1 Tax=Streptomyces sp. FH025 TaxID=2815937 RepID=UPI001FB01069|nr:MarR family transcriptional regulator [Streptomyces sp. FH025]